MPDIFIPPQYQALPATPEDRRWMDFVVQQVRACSKHSGSKHGSVITGPEGEFRSLGYNGMSRDQDDGDYRNTVHPRKRELTMCAERNGIANLEQGLGGSAEGCTLYADAVPCGACGDAIVKHGIGEVVFIGADHLSTSADHGFWKDGIARLVEGGVKVRQLEPDGPRYSEAARGKHYHLPIPSGTVDWDARFLAFAEYLSGWARDGVGEVLAYPPSRLLSVHDKLVRSLGCWSPDHAHGPLDALAGADRAGSPIAGATLYLAGIAPLDDPQRLVDHAITKIVLPEGVAAQPRLNQLRAMLGDAGIDVRLHRPDLQDFRALATDLSASAGPHPAASPSHPGIR